MDKENQTVDMQGKHILDWARFYVSKGFSIIPCYYKRKHPSILSWKEFQYRLPTDEELVNWFSSGEHNIAIVTGKISGIVAVDLDSEKAIEFAKANNFSPSPLSKTGRGYHIIYRYKEGVRNFQKRADLPSIDLKGDGGLIVVEPSVHPSGALYKWAEGKTLNDLPIAELPDIILAKNLQNKPQLRELYKGVSKGARNISLASLMGSWVNDGLTFEECLEQAEIWNSKNNPPMDSQELERTVKSILEKHHKEKNVVEGRGDILSFLLKWNDILRLDVKVEYILNKLIPKRSITLFFGKGGIGKTSLSMQIARAIAGGLPFGDLQTIKTPVYYIDYENPLAVLKERVERIGKSDNLYVWHISNKIKPPYLDNSDWGLLKGLPPGLLIFDTLRASHLSDENDSKPMSLIIGRLKELRELGFTILLLHHTPKSNESIYKGSTALLDLVDHVIGIESVNDAEAIEFDIDNLYRLGVRIKTRYEPFCIFLKFNPDTKGFEVAKDPDIEKMQDIYELLKKIEPAKQKELKDMIKKDLGYSDYVIRRLLKKGEGRYWTVKEDKDRKGSPKSYSCIYVDTIYSQQKNTNNYDRESYSTQIPSFVPTQNLDNPILVDNFNPNYTQIHKCINPEEFIDLTGADVEVIL